MTRKNKILAHKMQRIAASLLLHIESRIIVGILAALHLHLDHHIHHSSHHIPVSTEGAVAQPHPPDHIRHSPVVRLDKTRPERVEALVDGIRRDSCLEGVSDTSLEVPVPVEAEVGTRHIGRRREAHRPKRHNHHNHHNHHSRHSHHSLNKELLEEPLVQMGILRFPRSSAAWTRPQDRTAAAAVVVVVGCIARHMMAHDLLWRNLVRAGLAGVGDGSRCLDDRLSLHLGALGPYHTYSTEADLS